MPSRPDVSEKRKNQIIEAATNVFARLGFQKARMDDIVEESGLSKGTLYWYFKSKDDLIVGIIDKLLGNELTELRKLQATEGPVQEKLSKFIDITIDDFKRISPLLPMYYEFFAMAMRSQSIQSMFSRYFRSYMEVLTPLIQEGIHAREFEDIDATEAAIAIAAVLEGMIVLTAYDPDIIDLERHIRSASKILIDGMRRRPI